MWDMIVIPSPSVPECSSKHHNGQRLVLGPDSLLNVYILHK